jgi:hypothetical protein
MHGQPSVLDPHNFVPGAQHMGEGVLQALLVAAACSLHNLYQMCQKPTL